MQLTKEQLAPIIEAEEAIENIHPDKYDDVDSFCKAKYLALKEVREAINEMAGYKIYEIS